MDEINELITVRGIRRHLSALPATAQEAYQNTYNRIINQRPGIKGVALRTLRWVQHAQRPLSMVELQHALAIHDGMEDVDPEDLPSPKVILSSCQGLMVLCKADGTVDVVHSTARDFLRTHQPGGLDVVGGHHAIARACLTYLSVTELAEGPCATVEELAQRHSKLSLLDYSAHFLGDHIFECEQQSLDRLSRFLEQDKLRQSVWQILNFTVGFGSPIARQMLQSSPSQASALHCAAFCHGAGRF